MAIMSKLSALKPGTQKLISVLKKIKSTQTGYKRDINLRPEKFGQPYHQTIRFGTAKDSRLRLSQSHKQVRKIGKGKGYRDYLKRMT